MLKQILPFSATINGYHCTSRLPGSKQCIVLWENIKWYNICVFISEREVIENGAKEIIEVIIDEDFLKLISDKVDF